MRWPTGLDFLLLSLPILLSAAGIAVIYSIAPSGETPLALWQGIYALVGLGVMVALTILDYRTFRAGAPALYGVGLATLLLVLAVGTVKFGARRWLDIGPIEIQPSEFMKLVVLAALAWFFASRDEVKLADIGAAVVLLVIPVVLISRQPDFGTALLLMLGAFPIFLLSKIRREQWFGLILAALVALPLIFATLQPYQRARLYTFLNPSSDPFGAGYNVLQSIIAVGSGGLWGRGLGQGSQSTLEFVPVAHTDFIFAGLAEATGLLGSLTVLILFGLLIWRAVRLSVEAQDRFGRLLAAGIASLWLFSVFINVGMNLGVAPVTGVPLPFVSFGGSSMLTNFALAGILQSLALRRKKISFR